MSDPVNTLAADQLPVSDARLNEERERALETIAQNLRRPLIDQLNWCELLMTDRKHSLHSEHLEVVAKINSRANDLLSQVQDLLDEEKIRQRARTAEHQEGDDQREEARAPELRLVRETGTNGEPTGVFPTPAVPMETAAAPFCATGLYGPRRSGARILVVEDSSTLRDLLVGALRPTFHVLSAADGWEALQLMVERPDVIVAEVNLPVVDMADMLSHARQIAGDVAVLAIYGAEDAALLAVAQRRGVNEVLRKPFPVADVVEKVEALAASREAQATRSVLAVCSDPREGYALYHLLDTRYRTHFVTTAEAAQDATGNQFDVLIIEVTAGDGRWQDAVALCRKSNMNIRVLALVDSNDRGMLMSLRQAGITSAMLKPYRCDELLIRVRGLLGIQEIDGRILRSVLRRVAI